MKKNLSNWFLFFGILFLTLIISEIILGYIGFQRAIPDSFAISRIIKRKILPYKTNVEYISNGTNPFVTYKPKAGEAGYRLHPFIDYTRAQGLFENMRIPIDYFGFRNEKDIYFEERDKSHFLVVLTGGSEAVGYSHRTTIAENLQKILNKASGQKFKVFKVLNLAMNSYTISNEINAYVSLAYHLKPEFVISYSGANDLYAGIMVPYNFKKLGLNYLRFMEFWLPRLYDLKESNLDYGVINEKGLEIIVDSYLKNVEKYRKIVSSNGGKLIVGIQAYNKDIYFSTKTQNKKAGLIKPYKWSKLGEDWDSNNYPIYEKAYDLFQELIKTVYFFHF